MNTIELFKKLELLKKDYIKLKYNTKKTKTANDKRFDKMRLLRRKFNELQRLIDWSRIDVSKLNLMSPGAGPWCLLKTENYINHGFYFSFNFIGDNTRYVGEYSLLDDKCGIDNLNIIIDQIKE